MKMRSIVKTDDDFSQSVIRMWLFLARLFMKRRKVLSGVIFRMSVNKQLYPDLAITRP